MSDHPIIFIGFNRPNYTQQVIESLLRQENYVVDRARVYFFQDGGPSPFSGVERASKADLAETRKVFGRYFDSKNIFPSETNLGVALNFHRAERFVFENLGAEVAYFFEDDLELGQNYMATLEFLSSFILANRKDVAYFSCYGDQRGQYANSTGPVIPLDHQWAFGLVRDRWRSINNLMGWFYDIVSANDYRYRDNDAIFDGLQKLGYAAEGTSQDVVKAAIAASLDFARINTRATFGKYVGREGLHMNAKLFDELGYGSVKISEEPFAPAAADLNAAIDTVKKEQIGRFKAFHSKLPAIRQRFPKMVQPLHEQTVDSKLVRQIYNIMLLRHPENDELVNRVVERRISLGKYVREIANSREFQEHILESGAKAESKI